MGKTGGSPACFLKKGNKKAQYKEGLNKKDYIQKEIVANPTFFLQFLLFQYSFTEKNQQVQGYTFRS